MLSDDHRSGVRNDRVEKAVIFLAVVGVFILGVYLSIDFLWFVIFGAPAVIFGLLLTFNYKINIFFAKLVKRISKH